MPIIDIILLICFVPAIVLGLKKGLVKQAISLVSIIIGLWAGGRFAPGLSVQLMEWFQNANEVWMKVIAYILIFLVVGLVFGLIGTIITRLLKTLSLGWINKLLGVAFSILSTTLLIGLLIMVFEGLNANLEILDSASNETLANAKVYQTIKNICDGIFPYLKSLINV